MKTEPNSPTRRSFLSAFVMCTGLAASYGFFASHMLRFLIPSKHTTPTRKLFAGRVDQFAIGTVKPFFDLEGNQILIKRDASGFRAFNSTCPHLGCKVHWKNEQQEFFCPCHNGVFDADGKGTAGPPADGGQSLSEVPVVVDEVNGVVYLEVKNNAEHANHETQRNQHN